MITINGATRTRTTALELMDVEFALHRRDRVDPRGDHEEAIDLSYACDLIGYENRPQSGPCQHLGFAKLRRSDSDRAGSQLAPGDLRCLGCLEMGPQFLRPTAKICPHTGYVVLDEVKVEKQRGGIDIGLVHNAAVRAASAAKAPGRAPRATP